MKKYVLLMISLLTVCLVFASCDVTDLPLMSAPVSTEADTQAADTEKEDGSDAPGTTDTVPVLPEDMKFPMDPILNLSQSYATSNAIFFRAEHLNVGVWEGMLPTVLKISEPSVWNELFGEQNRIGEISDTVLGESLSRLSEEFFSTHSLLVVVTEGRSGSVRYRLDGTREEEGKLLLDFVTEIPPAVTMDIVHWCVVIPVDKEQAKLSVEPIFRDERPGIEEPETGTPVLLPKPRDEKEA